MLKCQLDLLSKQLKYLTMPFSAHMLAKVLPMHILGSSWALWVMAVFASPNGQRSVAGTRGQPCAKRNLDPACNVQSYPLLWFNNLLFVEVPYGFHMFSLIFFPNSSVHDIRDRQTLLNEHQFVSSGSTLPDGIPGALVQELAEPGMRCSSTRGGMEGRIAILKQLVCEVTCLYGSWTFKGSPKKDLLEGLFKHQKRNVFWWRTLVWWKDMVAVGSFFNEVAEGWGVWGQTPIHAYSRL